MNPIKLEEAYQGFIENLEKWTPDGLIPINLSLLKELGLLNFKELESTTNESLTQNFNVIETSDKVTLFNERFAVWIVPKSIEEKATTWTFISLLNNETPHLEIVFSTEGVYNAPKYILKVLHYFLNEMLDTEEIISSINKKS